MFEAVGLFTRYPIQLELPVFVPRKPTSNPFTWECPRSGCLKANFDGSLDSATPKGVHVT